MRSGRRARVWSLALPITCVAASLVAEGKSARAAEPQQDVADGVAACHAFEEKNAADLKAWEAIQPPVPYRVKMPETILDAPWTPLLAWFSGNLDLLAASFLPHLGAQIRGALPATTLSWPLTFAVGPYYSCSRKTGSFNVTGDRAHRIMLEPAVVLTDTGVGATVRPGYRFLYHPTDWVVGVGGGLGSTIELAGNHEPLRPSIGPEGVLHFGHCCEKGYFTLTLRFDYYGAGKESTVLGASLGYVYF